MHILITGAAGFIGQLLARALLEQTSHTLILTDIVPPPIPDTPNSAANATAHKADLAASPDTVVSPSLDAVYILHGIMSSGSEADFDLGMRVNMDSTRALLEALRHTCPGVRVVYASSQAVYGQPLPPLVTEDVVPTPESSYGCAKMVGEYLVNEYTRRGFISGFSLRFPTIVVRPGAPSAAASSFLSGMIREPLKGEECVIPLVDRGFRSWVCSPRTLVRNLLHVLTLDGNVLPAHKRAVNHPGIDVTIQEMLDALERVAGREVLGLIREETERDKEVILRSWPQKFDNSLAYRLGFERDQDFEGAVRDYARDVGFAVKG